MGTYIKNLFSEMQNVVKRGTVEVLCMVLAVCLIGVSCDRYEPSDTPQTADTIVKVCDVDNPLTDLYWLKRHVINPSNVIKIYQCPYNDTMGFLLVIEGISRYSLVNCEATTVCLIGEYNNTCEENGISVDFESRKLLWLHPKILRIFDDPLTNSEWLKHLVNTQPFVETVKIYKCNYIDGIGFLFDFVNSDSYTLCDYLGTEVCYSGYPGDCSRYNIDFESKVLIWEYIND